MKPRVLGMILAGGQGSRLAPLTQKRSKPAVPFGSKYRIIDFAINNFINSGMFSIYVLTQYKAPQYPTVSKNSVWDGTNRSMKARSCTSRCFSGWLQARTNSLRPEVITLHALLPCDLSRTLC